MKIFKNLTCFSIFFDLKHFNKDKLWYFPPKCVSLALFNYSSLSYIILALSSVVTNLPNKTLIFHDFHGPKIKFHDFPGLENDILKFHDLPGILRLVRTVPKASKGLNMLIYVARKPIHYQITRKA